VQQTNQLASPAANHNPIRRASGPGPLSYRRDRRRSTEMASRAEGADARVRGCYTVMRHGVELKNRIPPGQNVSGAIGLLGGNDNKYDGVAPFLGESWRTLASFLLQFAS
jgi:hypothetical protein